jgi:carboxylate-amine ligase
MGVELELQLVNPATYDLTAVSPDLIYLLGQSDFPGLFTPEVTESMIEVCTHVQTNYAGVLGQLQQIHAALITACDELNIAICGGGTHPFQSWAEQRIFAKERFLQLSDRYGYLAKQFTVFGQHIHIGCINGNDALYLTHALNRYIPHFIALSASSPFVQNRDTCFDSARLNSVFAFPLSGHAPFVLDWDQFADGYFAKMQRTGTIKSMKDFYWDLRPKPEYGTIELRVCDTPLTIKQAAVFAGYLQALCHHILSGERREINPDEYLVYNYNRFQACRFGLNGVIVDPLSYATYTVADDIRHTLAVIAPSAAQLEGSEALQTLSSYLTRGNDASWLRLQHLELGSLEHVVAAAIELFRHGSRG